MPCCAVNCKNKITPGSSIHLYSVPRNISRRNQWKIAINRLNHHTGKLWEPSNNARLCNKHFITGEPSSDPEDPDYVPSVFEQIFIPDCAEHMVDHPNKQMGDISQNKNVVEMDSSSSIQNIDHKICIFCPNKKFPSLEIFKQCYRNVYLLCHYCTSITSNIFEQINKLQAGKFFCPHCSVYGLNFEELVIHIRDQYGKEPCVCPEKFNDNKEFVNVKENIIFPLNDIEHDRRGESILPINNCTDVEENSILPKNSCIDVKEEGMLPVNCIVDVKGETTINMCTIKAEECSTTSNCEGHLGKTKCKCHSCSYQDNCKINFQSEMEFIMAETTFNCKYCKYTSLNEGQFEKHVKDFHFKEKLLHCDLCKYTTSFPQYLEMHIESVHIEKQFQCNQCAFETSSIANFKIHVRGHMWNFSQYYC